MDYLIEKLTTVQCCLECDKEIGFPVTDEHHQVLNAILNVLKNAALSYQNSNKNICTKILDVMNNALKAAGFTPDPSIVFLSECLEQKRIGINLLAALFYSTGEITHIPVVGA